MASLWDRLYGKVAQRKLLAVARRYAPLATVSFLTIYLELVVIRWLSSEVRIFAYFKNFPLLAAFCGIGIGCLLARRGRNYFRFAPLLLFVLVAVISFASVAGYTHITFIDPYEHYLLGEFNFQFPLVQSLKGMGAVLGIFILTVAFFASLGEKLGEYLNASPALLAYSVNVAASLAGILVYARLTWLEYGPAVWLLVACLGLLPFSWKSWRPALLVGVVLLPALLTPRSTIWSPYYRVDVIPHSLADRARGQHPIGYQVILNHDAMQGAFNYREEYLRLLPPEVQDQLLDYYNVSYRMFGNRFKKILVLAPARATI